MGTHLAEGVQADPIVKEVPHLLHQLGLPKGHMDSHTALGHLRKRGKEAHSHQVDLICSL